MNYAHARHVFCGAQGSTGAVRDQTGVLSAVVHPGVAAAAAAAATDTGATLAAACPRDETTCTAPLPQ